MMEGAPTASDLLAQIQTESLQTFLTSVRRDTSSAGSTYIPPLDTYLSSVNASRTTHHWPLNRGDVIEVQGPAASGKTQLLFHILVTCLLPSRYNGKHLGGWGKAAVLIDTDGKFSMSRIHELLVSRLTRLLGQNDSFDTLSVELDDLATQCLENLHVFSPTSSAQLAITILHLPKYHATDPRMRDIELDLLVIDSLSAFYWRDRYSLEQLREATDSAAHVSLPPNPLHYVVKALQAFRSSHRPVILLSNWGLNVFTRSAPEEPEPPFYRQHLHPFPAPFEAHGAAEAVSNIQSSQQQRSRSPNVDASRDSPTGRARRPLDAALPLHYHITLHPSRIDPFPASYTLAEAVAQEHMRATLVNRGEIQGRVRTPGSNDVGEFAFWIGEKEIFVDAAERPP